MSQPTILKLKVSKTGHVSITFRNLFLNISEANNSGPPLIQIVCIFILLAYTDLMNIFSKSQRVSQSGHYAAPPPPIYFMDNIKLMSTFKI